jgi:hypothetical protein
MEAQPAKPARRSAALVACLALILALPGTALAQGAGDNQYQDPFGVYQGGGSQKQASSGSGSHGSSSQGAGSSSSGSSSSGSSTTAGQVTGSTPGASMPASPATSGRLPATGGEPLALAALGAGLLLAGVGLRLRLRRPLG